MAQPLHLTFSSEWIWDTSLSLGGNLDLENTKLLLEVLKLHSGQWLRQHISYLFVRRNILELHCSYLHHIPDIVILDLDMLQLVMEHYILRATLVVTMYTSSIHLRSNKSGSSFLSHTASQLDEQVVTYSASAVLSATQDCFMLNQEITPDPILKQHPEVLFLSMELPSQSEST